MNCVNSEVGLGSTLSFLITLNPPTPHPPSLINHTVSVDEKHHEKKKEKKKKKKEGKKKRSEPLLPTCFLQACVLWRVGCLVLVL